MIIYWLPIRFERKEVGCCNLAFGCAAHWKVQAATGTLSSAKPQFKLNAFEALSASLTKMSDCCDMG